MKRCALLVCFTIAGSAAIVSKSESSDHSCSVSIESRGIKYSAASGPEDCSLHPWNESHSFASSSIDWLEKPGEFQVEAFVETGAFWGLYFPPDLEGGGIASDNSASARHNATWLLTTPGQQREGLMRVTLGISSFKNGPTTSLGITLTGPGFRAGCDNYNPYFPGFDLLGCFAPTIAYPHANASATFWVPVTLGKALEFKYSAGTASSAMANGVDNGLASVYTSASFKFFEVDGVTAATPEPGGVALLLSGLAVLAVKSRTRFFRS